MFNCDFCGRAFTRMFNLARHLKTKHNISNNGNDVKDINNNEYGTAVNDNDDDDLSDTSKENDDSDADSRNKMDNGNSQLLSSENKNFEPEFSTKKDHFNRRILAATEAIKSKFNSLRKLKNGIQCFENKNLVQKDQGNTFMKIVPENNNDTIFHAKLPELLQCALDILMIKELQNVDIRDKDEENLDDDEDRGIRFKRSNNSTDKQGNEDEIKSSEEIPLKRLKYNNSMEYGNDGFKYDNSMEYGKDDDDDNDNSSINSDCVVRKYWHNPNTLVDELKKLISTTKIGQQISTIMKSLKEINNSSYTNNYLEYDEQRNELIRNLNELKKTDIGQEIFCIFHELEKAEIIEPIDYVIDEEEYSSDKEDDNIIDEGVMTGKGLYIRPYRSLIRT